MGEYIISASGPQYGMVVNSDGSINVSGCSSGGGDYGDQYIQRIDYDGGTSPVYLGYAAPGTNTGSANWQLRKIEYSGTAPQLTSAVLFGSGNTSFDKVWDNRSGTGEVYS